MIRTEASCSVSRFAELVSVPRRPITPAWRARVGDPPNEQWPAPVVDRIEPTLTQYAAEWPASGYRKIAGIAAPDGCDVESPTSVKRAIARWDLLQPVRYQAERRQLAAARRDRSVTAEGQRHRGGLELLREPPPRPRRELILMHHRQDYLPITVSSQRGTLKRLVPHRECRAPERRRSTRYTGLAPLDHAGLPQHPHAGRRRVQMCAASDPETPSSRPRNSNSQRPAKSSKSRVELSSTEGIHFDSKSVSRESGGSHRRYCG